MKKQSLFLAIATASALSFSAAASAQQGMYFQGDLGLGNLKVDNSDTFHIREAGRSIKNAYKDSGFMPRLSLGTDMGALRVAVDYTHYKQLKDSVSEDGISADASVKASGFGLAAIYDFENPDSAFEPYVGGRLAINKIKSEAGISVAGRRSSNSDSETKLGYGLIAGVGYKLSSDMVLDFGYRYNRMTSDVYAHEVSAGLRFYF
ncbi:MAG: opacity family porin [Lautropia sp.]|nr:opacity family porin [Lautropia sp.]